MFIVTAFVLGSKSKLVLARLEVDLQDPACSPHCEVYIHY